jgi:hypothetical protein
MPALFNRLRQNIDPTGLEFGEASQDFRRKGEDMDHAIGFGAQHDDGERKRSSFVLPWQSFVHGEKKIELA